MDASSLRSLLEAIRDGRLTLDEAERRLRPLEEIGGFATIDLHRRKRCGFPEVIFGQGKTPEQVARIVHLLRSHGESVLATRLAPEAAARLQQEFPEGRYHAQARTFHIAPTEDPGPKVGRVVVVTAGTSDLPVAEEARITAEAWNCEVELVADVGVAGIHRLFHRLPSLHGADAIVVVAGMEGALPSVVGGLVDCPVIAVPTSIGYGASFGGIAALLGMLNSCASNIAVVNIDAGFNGGHYAALIARRAGLARGHGHSSPEA
jgi:NCAIR mutase (PurE)-related protein